MPVARRTLHTILLMGDEVRARRARSPLAWPTLPTRARRGCAAAAARWAGSRGRSLRGRRLARVWRRLPGEEEGAGGEVGSRSTPPHVRAMADIHVLDIRPVARGKYDST